MSSRLPRDPHPSTAQRDLLSPGVSRAGGLELSSSTVGALPILNGILERMRLREFLGAYLSQTGRRAKIAVEDVLLVLVRNILVSREPLYGIGDWARHQVPDLLSLTSEQLGALNDDRIGRSLDRLFDADRGSLALALIEHVVREFQVGLDELHNDSTTISFCGDYPDAFHGARTRGKFTLAMLHGHNKDHRPDLKQLLFILTVSQDGGVPVHFATADGNVTDDKTHRNTWDLLCQLHGRQDFLYVADSKLATAENLAHIAGRGGRFVTVLPRTRNEDRSFRELVRKGEVSWEEIYRKYEDEELVNVFRIARDAQQTVEGYRLLWFHSARKEGRDRDERGKRIGRAMQALAELREKLRSPRTRWRDRGKIAAKVEALLSDHGASSWIRVEVQEEEEARYRQEKRGRPGKDTRYQKTTRCRFDLSFQVDVESVAGAALTDGIFPLVSNDGELTEKELLLAYKRQAVVEKRFRQLKSDYQVAPMHLKSVSRLEAFLCIYFFGLVVQSLLQRELRRTMETKNIQALPLYHEERACRAPCARSVLDLFEHVQRHELTEKGRPRAVLVTELSPVQRRILKLLKVSLAPYESQSAN